MCNNEIKDLKYEFDEHEGKRKKKNVHNTLNFWCQVFHIARYYTDKDGKR